MAYIFTNCSNTRCASSGRFLIASRQTLLRCAGCKEVVYCDGVCQKEHWTAHKPLCEVAKSCRDLVHFFQRDSILNSYLKESATVKSNVPSIGYGRRVVAFDFPHPTSLHIFAESKGRKMEGDIFVHHLTPIYCEQWKRAGAQLRGEAVADCLAVESVILDYVNEYNSTKEAVLCLRTMVDGAQIVRPMRVAFIDTTASTTNLCKKEPPLVEIPEDYVFKGTVEDLIDWCYPELKTPGHADTSLSKAILTAHNVDVDKLNEIALMKMTGDVISLLSADCVHDDGESTGPSGNLYTTEFLNSLNVSGLPPHNLRVKIGVPVVLLCNLDPKKGLCNGTRLIVQAATRLLLTCKVESGPRAGDIAYLPRIDLVPSNASSLPCQLERRQFPVRLAYAMSANKAQGQSLQRVGVFLPKPMFSHGQLYVALLRSGVPSHTKILIVDEKKEEEEREEEEDEEEEKEEVPAVIDVWAALEAIKRDRPEKRESNDDVNPALAVVEMENKKNIETVTKATSFPVGATVRLFGLKIRSDLNGTLAIVMKPEENQRIHVSCDQFSVAVKSCNLEFVSHIASEEM